MEILEDTTTTTNSTPLTIKLIGGPAYPSDAKEVTPIKDNWRTPENYGTQTGFQGCSHC